VLDTDEIAVEEPVDVTEELSVVVAELVPDDEAVLLIVDDTLLVAVLLNDAVPVDVAVLETELVALVVTDVVAVLDLVDETVDVSVVEPVLDTVVDADELAVDDMESVALDVCVLVTLLLRVLDPVLDTVEVSVALTVDVWVDDGDVTSQSRNVPSDRRLITSFSAATITSQSLIATNRCCPDRMHGMEKSCRLNCTISFAKIRSPEAALVHSTLLAPPNTK
jgi:hypothetical protein